MLRLRAFLVSEMACVRVSGGAVQAPKARVMWRSRVERRRRYNEHVPYVMHPFHSLELATLFGAWNGECEESLNVSVGG